MAQHVSRDLACASGPDFVYALVSRLVLHGWSVVAWSDGSARTVGSAGLDAASDLAAANAWVVVNHTASGRRMSFQRRAAAHTWTLRYTPAGAALDAGDAVTPDSHATTRTFFDNAQLYPTNAPTATKAHLVVDDAKAGFVALLRRTPYAGGDACAWIFAESFAPNLSWNADPDPCVVGATFHAGNAAVGAFYAAGTLRGWFRRGLAGEAFDEYHAVENCFGACGHGTALPGGVDTEFAVRVGRVGGGGGLGFPIGVSTLLRGLNPWLSPTTGLDAGGTLTRACFGGVTVANDGAALES